MTAKGAFRGDGVALNEGGAEGVKAESKGDGKTQVGTGFGKRAVR